MIRKFLSPLRSFLMGVRRDSATGHLYYRVDGIRHFIRRPADAARLKYRRYAFEQVYFRCYRPTGADVVVDIGAGLGTEIIPLGLREPRLRYFAVEIQPWVFECLCLTLAQLPPGFQPVGTAIGQHEEIRITPTQSGIDAESGPAGVVPVACVPWSEFVARNGIDDVDLLKMNVEGAEAALLEHIDLGQVRRVVVGTHDFRADRGEGERFRTRDRVEERMRSQGFDLTELTHGWLYAERR